MVLLLGTSSSWINHVISLSLLFQLCTVLLYQTASAAFAANNVLTSNVIFPDEFRNFDEFGSSISTYGNRVLVGAPSNSDGQGAAYLFEKVGSDWVEVNFFELPEGKKGDQFGGAVGLYDGSILIGAPQLGAVYQFEETSSGWVMGDVMQPTDVQRTDSFGCSIAIDGNTAIVGAYNRIITSSFNAGAAFVYKLSGEGWVEEAVLYAPGGRAYDLFGFSVSISNGVAAIGAPGRGSGSVYIYSDTAAGGGGTWSEVVLLHPEVDSQQLPSSQVLSTTGRYYGSKFGYAVSTDGEKVAVGAPYVNSEQGEVLIYATINGQWTLEETLTQANTSRLGTALVIQDDFLVVSNDNHFVLAFNYDKDWLYSYSLSTDYVLTESEWFGTSLAVSESFLFIGCSSVLHYGQQTGALFYSRLGCPSGYFGPSCLPCSCDRGTCLDGLTRSGHCSDCEDSYYGEDCTSSCSCPDDQLCFTGIDGNGTCFTCPSWHYGETCALPCSCPLGNGTVCSEGPTGDGLCKECRAGFYGSMCTPCQCKNGGICNDTVDGDGTCHCIGNFKGEYCQWACDLCLSKNCTANGTCWCEGRECPNESLSAVQSRGLYFSIVMGCVGALFSSLFLFLIGAFIYRASRLKNKQKRTSPPNTYYSNYNLRINDSDGRPDDGKASDSPSSSTGPTEGLLPISTKTDNPNNKNNEVYQISEGNNYDKFINDNSTSTSQNNINNNNSNNSMRNDSADEDKNEWDSVDVDESANLKRKN